MKHYHTITCTYCGSEYLVKNGHSEKHIIGKDETWKIERKNLNFRTHIKRLNRKTICYSKNEKIHDNVIGMYIDRYYYKTGRFGNSFINGFNP